MSCGYSLRHRVQLRMEQTLKMQVVRVELLVLLPSNTATISQLFEALCTVQI